MPCCCGASIGCLPGRNLRHDLVQLRQSDAGSSLRLMGPAEPSQRCRVSEDRPKCQGVRGHMGRQEYRRYARECLEMANATDDPKVRATLLQMAQTWFRLAD